MNGPTPVEPDWENANRAHLSACLGVLKQQLRGAAATGAAISWPVALADRPPALAQVTRRFGLSPFERDLLLLCAGIELDAEIAALCAAVQGDPSRPWPSFGLALSALSAPHWGALAPNAPLRRLAPLDITSGPPLTQAMLRIDERLLHYLAGVALVDERLSPLLRRLPPVAELSPAHDAVARALAGAGATGARSRCLSTSVAR